MPYPSGEPTTTEAERVVIVGYNRASPAVKLATLRTGFTPFFFSLSFDSLFESFQNGKEKVEATERMSFVVDLPPEGCRFLRLFSIQLGIKGKGKEARMDLRYPAWIRRSQVVESTGIGDLFRWDTLDCPDRFHDRLDFRIADKETAPYHSSISEPD